jgi:hypothetical protein
MRRRVTVLVIAALVAGAVAISQSTAGAIAGQPKSIARSAKLDDLHAKRPIAANFELIAKITKRAADGAPGNDPAAGGSPAASNTAQAQSDALSVEAARTAELQRQFFDAVQRVAMQDFFEGVYVLDGWSRFGGTLACIRDRESHGNYAAVNRRSRAAGAYQFLQGTWNGTAAQAGRPDLVGVFPADARPLDQDFLAVHLMDAQGYRPWIGGRRCR